MPRTPGAKNRTTREIEKDLEHQRKQLNLKRRIERKDAQIAALKSKKSTARGAK